jgi:hypothetical protein
VLQIISDMLLLSMLPTKEAYAESPDSVRFPNRLETIFSWRISSDLEKVVLKMSFQVLEQIKHPARRTS